MFANFQLVTSLTEHPLFRRLVELDLERAHFAVFGSAPLFVRGIISEIQDLDLVARGPAWQRANELGIPTSGILSSHPIIHFWGGRIEVFREWLPPHFDTDALIDEADIINDLRFVRPEHVVAYKTVLNRPKDILHLKALRGLLQVDQKLSQ